MAFSLASVVLLYLFLDWLLTRVHMAHEISSKRGKIWIFAQILLFAMVGSQVELAAEKGWACTACLPG